MTAATWSSSNAQAVARGYYSEADVRFLYDWMNEELTKEGAHLDALYYCPHHPEGRVPAYTMACDCRKPHPKMVNDACEDYAVDKAASFFIGDTDGDMQCARNAGVRGLRYKGGSLLKLVENNVK